MYVHCILSKKIQVSFWVLFPGNYCDERGCPGDPDQPEKGSCTGQGTCILADQKCDCNYGWQGDGCELPDCPGDPDCNLKGLCLFYI